MSDGPLFGSLPSGPVHEAFTALRRDLLADGGPRISTMRNHRYAIVVYPPEREFEVRRAVGLLSEDLHQQRWNTLDVSLQRALLERIATLPEDLRSFVRGCEMEFHVQDGDPERGLAYLKEQLVPLLEGVDGLAATVVKAIDAFARAHPGEQDRSVVFLSRLSSLYPFLRASTLLKHIAGRTHQFPVVLLYPGTQQDRGLSFLGELSADRDYRPRLYP